MISRRIHILLNQTGNVVEARGPERQERRADEQDARRRQIFHTRFGRQQVVDQGYNGFRRQDGRRLGSRLVTVGWFGGWRRRRSRRRSHLGGRWGIL